MRLPARTALDRLLLSLEELGRQADAAMSAHDLAAFLACQERAAPLVNRIARLAAGEQTLDADLAARGRAFIQMQAVRLERAVQETLPRLKNEIALIDRTRARIRALRPAYGAPPASRAPGAAGGNGGFSARG